MASNTPSYAANIAVRAFLTRVGRLYLGRVFDTRYGKGKEDWIRIKESVFENSCAYCGATETKLTIEHLEMFNKSQCGLHHPGNIVPCCESCNVKRGLDDKNEPVDWETHLRKKNSPSGTLGSSFKIRLNRIRAHINREGYPNMNKDERQELKRLAESLYGSITDASKQAIDDYQGVYDLHSQTSSTC